MSVPLCLHRTYTKSILAPLLLPPGVPLWQTYWVASQPSAHRAHGCQGGSPGKVSVLGGLCSCCAVGPVAPWVCALQGRVEVFSQGRLEGPCARFVLGCAAVWRKAEELPASEVESPQNRVFLEDKAAAGANPVHCKACECQTACSSRCLPLGPVAAILFPLAMEEVCVGGPMTCQRPMTSYWWGFSLGVWPNNVIFIGGHRAAPLFRTAWAVVLDSRESRSVFCSWPGHLAGAFTSGSPPSSSWRAFTSPAASPAVTLLPPSSFSGLPLCSPSDPSKEARCLSAE